MALSNDEVRKSLFKAADALERAIDATRGESDVKDVATALRPAIDALKTLGNDDVRKALEEAARSLNNAAQETRDNAVINTLVAALTPAIQFLERNPGPPPVLRDENP